MYMLREGSRECDRVTAFPVVGRSGTYEMPMANAKNNTMIPRLTSSSWGHRPWSAADRGGCCTISRRPLLAIVAPSPPPRPKKKQINRSPLFQTMTKDTLATPRRRMSGDPSMVLENAVLFFPNLPSINFV